MLYRIEESYQENRRKLAIRKIFKSDDKTRDKYLHAITDYMDIL